MCDVIKLDSSLKKWSPIPPISYHRLYKQPTTKSNRGIILNAVEYCVFPGAVNRDAKNRVLDEIHRSETRHFLILFRDARCQFRALYAYTPDCEDGQEVVKLYGTGPKLVTDRMFDQFFKRVEPSYATFWLQIFLSFEEVNLFSPGDQTVV